MGGAETQGVGGQRFREKGGQVKIRERGVRDTERERQRPRQKREKRNAPYPPKKSTREMGGCLSNGFNLSLSLDSAAVLLYLLRVTNQAGPGPPSHRADGRSPPVYGYCSFSQKALHGI